MAEPPILKVVVSDHNCACIVEKLHINLGDIIIIKTDEDPQDIFKVLSDHKLDFGFAVPIVVMKSTGDLLKINRDDLQRMIDIDGRKT